MFGIPLPIVIAIVTYLLSVATGNKKNALAAAAVAGLGTYAYLDYTNKPTGFEPSTALPAGTTRTPTIGSDGKPVLDAAGQPTYTYTTGGVTSSTPPAASASLWSSITDWFRGLSPTTAAALIGGAGVATGAISTSWIAPVALLVVGFLVLK